MAILGMETQRLLQSAPGNESYSASAGEPIEMKFDNGSIYVRTCAGVAEIYASDPAGGATNAVLRLSEKDLNDVLGWWNRVMPDGNRPKVIIQIEADSGVALVRQCPPDIDVEVETI